MSIVLQNMFNKKNFYQAWQHMPKLSAYERLRQEDHQTLKVSLSYMVSSIPDYKLHRKTLPQKKIQCI